jgi:ubiquinone/menaquinone biosynthesis C-methylase UbiE
MSSQPMHTATDIQRAYYAKTASDYDGMHVAADDEHGFALAYMISIADHLSVKSILDVGSGTGRALLAVKRKLPHVRIVGVEPSPELRQIGHSKGLSPTELVDGDAMKLAYDDGAFDLVCEYGALHHIPRPAVAVSEMLRVARTAVFISDCNNFGRGRGRFLKQAIDRLGAWPIADFIKTRGKGYSISEGDGLGYSYSVFNDYAQIKRRCRSVHVVNTTNAGPNLYRSASHVALLGIKASA